ncbi:MAG: Concanavalin A-like lectin/glucanase superfamily, partial [Chloroflexota bacterium]
NTRTYTGFLNASASAAYTVSLWVKPQNYDAWLVGQDVRNQRLRIGINPNGQATFERARECFRAYCWSQTPLVTTAKLPLGVWSHVAVSVNGNSEAVYLNGVLDATRTATDWSPPITAVSGLTAPTTNGVAPAIQTNWYGSSDPVATVEGWAFAPTNRTVRVRDGGVLDGAEGFTIMASVYPDVPDTTTMNDFFIVTREQNYTLKIHNNRLYYAVGVWSSGAGSTWRWIDSELMVNRRTWNKIAITYDKNKAGTQQIMVQVNDQRKYYQGLNAMSSSAPTTDLEIGRRQSDGAVAFVGKIDDVLIVPRGLSNAEVTALQSTSSPSDDAFAAIPNLVAYGNVAPLAPVNYGAEFIGELDGLRVSPFSLGSDAIAAQIKEAPSWNLTFEDTISTQRTTVTNGVTATVTIDSAALPDPVPSRSGIDRFLYAATCTNTGITGVECPTGNIIGMNGIAEGFDGRTTLLEVGRPKTLLDEIAAAGTIQLTVQPDSGVNARQILVQYGEAAGANTDPAFEISLTADQKVRIKIGATVFTAGTALTPAWNHIAFSYSSSSFVYIQNGVIDPTSSAVAGATFTTSNTGRLFIGGGVANTARASLFRGEIDDISFTPSVLPARKAYRLARAQFSGTVAKTTVGSVTIDADAPVVTIRTPAYVARLPRQILIQTSDKTTQVTGATYRTSLTNSTNAVAVDTTAPLCLDAVAADSFCPTFRVPEGAAATVEGRYTIHAAAYDTARNLGSAETTVLVDATAGSLALQRPTKPYTTTAEPGSSLRLLTLKIAATDPTLSNSSNAPGSGIVDVSVTVKDLSGHTLTLAPVPAVQKSDYWYATVPLPFGNPTGFYQVYGNATDAVGNTVSDVPLAVANGGVNGPIEVDTTAPHDVITYPDPDSANDYLVAHAPMTGRVSDINDGRAAIQRGLRVRLDFEAPDGAHAFDNRADSRYTTDCVACPVIAKDTVDATRRVARVNIDGTLQSLTIHNAATVLSGTFSVALMAKIADTGTLVASGIAANPRLRIHVDKVGGGFRLNARRGSVVLSSAPTLAPGKWYHILYSETGTTMSLAYGESLGAMTTASKPFAARTAFVLQPNLTLGAMQSARGATAMEDYFRGYLDDVLMSAFVLNPDDLLGAAIGAGSGTRMHQTRLAIVDDGTTNPDTLGRRARYYAPLNNTKLPVIDAVAGAMGSFCAAGVSLRTLTCPSIGDGYSTRALDLTRATDGTELGYRITTASDAAVTTGVRFRRNESATSGVFYSLQSTTQASLCAQYSYAAEKNTLVIALKCGDQASVAVPIDDTRWHTVT